MQEIGAFEAKNTLGALLDRVQKGEEIIITRHGKPVARLTPETGTRNLDAARAAAARLRARANGARLGTPIAQDEWKAFREAATNSTAGPPRNTPSTRHRSA